MLANTFHIENKYNALHKPTNESKERICIPTVSHGVGGYYQTTHKGIPIFLSEKWLSLIGA